MTGGNDQSLSDCGLERVVLKVVTGTGFEPVTLQVMSLIRVAADYVLGTFPIVRREEEARFQGRFRSRDLILATMAALAAGAPDAPVAG